MDLDIGKLSYEQKELNTQGSWIPVTPVKLVLDIPKPSGENPKINHLRDKNVVGSENFPTSNFDSNRGADNLEAALAEKVQVSGNNDHLASSSNIPFVNLSAESALGSGSTTRAGYLARSCANGFDYDWQSKSSWEETVHASSFLTIHDLSLGLSQRIGGNVSPQMASCELPYGLNVLPDGTITDKLPGSTVLQFAPITPDKLTNQVNQNKKEVANIQAGISDHHQEKTFLSSEALSPAVSTVEADNQNPVNSFLSFDPNKRACVTPQVYTRRRKHRPRVITEGKPRSIRKPAMPKDDPLKESSTGKRKNVRNKGFVNCPTTPAEVAQNISDPTPAETKTKSAKKALDFKCYKKLENEIPVCHSTIVNPELQVGSKQTGTANDFVCYINRQLEDYLASHTAQPASSPRSNNANIHCEKLNPCKQLQNDGIILNSNNLAVRNANASNCGSTSSLAGGETVVKKRQCVHTFGMQDSTTRNLCASNGLKEAFHVQAFSNRTSGMLFPEIYKKRRTEFSASNTSSSMKNAKNIDKLVQEHLKCQPGASTVGSVAIAPQLPMNRTQIRQAETVRVVAMDRVQGFECMLAIGDKERLTKKRSKAPTRVCDLAPLIGLSGRKLLPALPGKQALLNGDARRAKVSNVPQNCIEALVTETRATLARRKRSKKQASSSRNAVQIYQNNSIYTRQNDFPDPKGLPEFLRKQLLSVDAITERLKHLDINMEMNIISYQNAIVPFTARYQPQNAFLTRHITKQQENTLVVSQSDGPFYPIKKHRPRPKVDIDEETNKVWHLLLDNINNKGIDGTDEQKEKWWEEERKVFRGRADSFIARMHLVQGDRRFSKWKGSVLDSVIGVFLTQNVSDHLSSSAFMSMASHFPVKSKKRQCYEEPHPDVEEPDICPQYMEDNIKGKEKTPDKKEVDYSNESSGCSTGPLSTNDAFKCHNSQHSFRSRSSDLESFRERTMNKSTSQRSVRETTSYFIVDNVISSRISIESSVAHTTQIILEQYSENDSDVHDPAISVQELTGVSQDLVQPINNSQDATSDKERSVGEPAILDSPTHERDNELQQNKVSNFSGEISDVRESSIMFNYQKNTEHNRVETNPKEGINATVKELYVTNDNILREMRKTVRKEKVVDVDWDGLRKQAQANGIRERTADTLDSLDWEAVRCAAVGEIAHTIRERGMNNMLAERIKDFLNRLVREHGSLDIEWLRDVPPDKAKEYLLSVRGLGLKSVECVRLLTLHHLAFPVDTNVGRIAVRLGWVPLQPLPESLQLHLLELYPVLESIQKYLWPRLCKLDQRTLYELHYQMITFGKVFCTKTKPNCNACPMRGECRHFASAFASARLALPAPEEKSMVSATENRADGNIPTMVSDRLLLSSSQVNQQLVENYQLEATQPSDTKYGMSSNEPIIEEPATPEPQCIQITECDIEDACFQDPDEIPMIKLNSEEFAQTLQDYMQKNMELQEGDMSRALVALGPEAASIPLPKLKYISRLRTEHQVYELPDSHPLLQGLDKREPDDPCSYLLAIWTPSEITNSIQPPRGTCNSQDVGKLCSEMTCFSCNSIREANSQTVRGTLLIPCRTAMRGSFPLNGTYFQVNEVFADHDSSLNPIDVPRAWIWNLPRRTVYFGTSIPTIFKGLTTEGIQYCFWRGFVCVRGFDQKERAPRPLITRLHFPASKVTQRNAKSNGH